MTELLAASASICSRTSLPLVADCDSGFGEVRNVIHAVERYEAAGVAGICIEDKPYPKRNSFLEHQSLVPASEFAAKVAAARDAAADPTFVVVARTEALIAGASVGEAVRRGRMYCEHGADAILIHSKAKSPDQLLEFAKAWDNHAPLVIVPTTYPASSALLESGAVRLVVFANHALRASAAAVDRVARVLAERWELPAEVPMHSMNDVFALQGVPAMEAAEAHYNEIVAAPRRADEPVDGNGQPASFLRSSISTGDAQAPL